MNYNRIVNNIKSIFVLFVLPYRNAKYLEAGLYKYNHTVNALYRSEHESIYSKELRDKLFAQQSSSTNVFRNIYSSLYRAFIHGIKKSFSGQLMVISTSEKEYKFFDFKQKRLLTLYTDGNRFSSILKNRIQWSKFFAVPTFDYDEEKREISESLLDSDVFNYDKTVDRLVDELSLSHFSIFSNYRVNNSFENYAVESFLSEIGRSNYLEDLLGFISSDCFRTTLSHGDLWRSNLLWSNEVLYYLDYEMIGNRVFFYDLFTFIFSEAYFLNNIEALKKYVLGKYDLIFEKLFRHAGVKYCGENRNTYLYVFLYLYYQERWSRVEHKEVLDKLSSILNIIGV